MRNDFLCAGGGWDLSAGVRAAVMENAVQRGLQLHVEQGTAWSLSGSEIRETSNGTVDASVSNVTSNATAAAADKFRVTDATAAREQRRLLWLGNVFRVLEEGDDVVALRKAVGKHGRPMQHAMASTAPTMPLSASALPQQGALPPPPSGTLPPPPTGTLPPPPTGTLSFASLSSAPKYAPAPLKLQPENDDASRRAGVGVDADADDDEIWIDSCGDDKRHLTPLMRAAKHGRLGAVLALLGEHGADVNKKADRSGYTALLVAAYDGQEDIVRALLARGADPLLPNKWGETAISSTERAGRGAILALLRDAVTAREAAERRSQAGGVKPST